MPMTFKISSEFGAIEQVRGNVPHTGIDVPLEIGTKLRSIVNGTVEKIYDMGTQNIGKGVVIRGDDGNLYTYGHLSKIMVKLHEKVHAGRDIIGLSGNSGHSTGAHLHFAIQHNGQYVDPTPAVKALEEVSGNESLLFRAWDGIINFGTPSEETKHWVMNPIKQSVGGWLKDTAIDLGHWIFNNIPDIMGYGALLAAVCIILGSMIGKGGMIKPLAVYAGTLIIAVLLRAN